jgi:phage-related protein
MGLRSECHISSRSQDKLYDVRAEVNRNAIRVIYFLYTDRRFILLHEFHKKTQKTPKKELEKAKKYLEDFLEQNSDSVDETLS